MGGEGSMMVAQALMKMNRRRKKNHFKKDKIDGPYHNTTPLVLKKASEQKCLALKKEVDRLKNREQIRAIVCALVVCVFSLWLLVKICI